MGLDNNRGMKGFDRGTNMCERRTRRPNCGTNYYVRGMSSLAVRQTAKFSIKKERANQNRSSSATNRSRADPDRSSGTANRSRADQNRSSSTVNRSRANQNRSRTIPTAREPIKKEIFVPDEDLFSKPLQTPIMITS